MFDPISLKFTTESWTIAKLLKIYSDKRISLSPHYQRNPIWSLKAQRELIDTVQRGYPIPNFFVRLLPRNKYEMVDGQQRARTLIGYWTGGFSDASKLILSDEIKSDPKTLTEIESFTSYPLAICVLNKSVTDKDVESFYVLVNSTGLRLNRPELRKAEFYETRFLELCTALADDPLFEDLNLFSVKSTDRMNDIDFISELITFVKFGFTDKKEMVDELYKSDVTVRESNELKAKVQATLTRINRLNDIVPINVTRFKQKADFYTLFAFLSLHADAPPTVAQRAYHILLKLSPHIRPSQEECEPLFNYAINCVSQSHLKKAREDRNALFESLFTNKTNQPNEVQAAVADYFGFKGESYERIEGFLLFRLESL